jgi:hypothetical protein
MESSIPDGASMMSALENKGNPPMQTRLKMTIREFWREQNIRGNDKIVPWRKAPTKQNSRTSSSTGPPLSEFERLLGILATAPTVRRAIIESGLERTRAQLDARVPRDSFWSTAVAPAFNDASIVPVVSCFNDWADEKGGKLQVETIPSVRRDGSELKRWYQDCRASFTVSYNKWSRSGQNDPESFENFVPRHSRGFSALGKRILVIGAALQVGRPDVTVRGP